MPFRIEETDYRTAQKVHSKIPEFNDSYLEENRDRNEDRLILIAYESREPVGYTVGYDRYDDDSYYFWMSGVIPEARREGVMKLMLEKFEEKAREKNYSKISIKTENQRKSMRHFLIDNGFNVVEFYEKETVEKK